MGLTGLILVTIAAAFSTGSAINATLFSTGRLMENVAKKKDLLHLFAKENSGNIPYYAVISIAALAAILAVIGSLQSLVDAASLIFLITFGVVNLIAINQKNESRFFSFIGTIGCAAAIVFSVLQQIDKNPVALIIMFVFIIAIMVGRPVILKKTD